MYRFLAVFLMSMFLSASFANAGDNTIIVASDATWPPMELLNADKEVTGLAPDYVKALAKETGLNLVVQNTAWDGIFSALASGQVNMIASSVTITEERKKNFLFSIPYCTVHQSVVVRKGDTVKSLQDLNGKMVGGQIGTTGIIQTLPKAKIDAEIKTYDEVGLAFEALARGDIFAVVCDSPVARYYANRRKDFDGKFQVVFTTPESEEYGFVFRKDEKALADTINKGILALRKSGVEAEIYNKWLGE